MLALDRLLSVPLEVLWAEQRRKTDALIATGTALGAPAWTARPSPAVAVLKPPAGVTGRQVAARLADMGQRALPGQAPHEDTVFRVSTMGYADRYDALAIAGMLEDCFAGLGVRFERGAAVQAVLRFAEEIGMVPIHIQKEQAGYILNTLLVPFLTAASHLWVNDIAQAEDIDKTWRIATGAPLGPFQMFDIIGLNTPYNILSHGDEHAQSLAAWLKENYIDKGRLGIASGEGFYSYKPAD